MIFNGIITPLLGLIDEHFAYKEYVGGARNIMGIYDDFLSEVYQGKTGRIKAFIMKITGYPVAMLTSIVFIIWVVPLKYINLFVKWLRNKR